MTNLILPSKPQSATETRPLGLLDLTCIGINAIVGSGIFLFPGQLAEKLGPASVLAFGVTALLLMPVALCFARAASLFDGHGGPYLYARRAFGADVGYAIGWMCWVTVIFSWAAVANGLGSYLGVFGEWLAQPWCGKFAAVLVIGVLGAINYCGVKLGAWTSNFFTAAKLLPLLLFAAVGLAHLKPGLYHPWSPHGYAPLGSACFLAYFAFLGFEVVPVPAGEAAGARRKVPRALLTALVVSAILYMVIQAVAVGVDPKLAGSKKPLAQAAAVMMGPAGATLIAIGALLSMLGFNAGCALGGPRYLVALSQQGDWPAALSASHKRFQTPSRAIVVTAGLAAVAAMLLDFGKLVNMSNVVLSVQYLATCAAMPILFRDKTRSLAGKLKLWLVPALGIAATLWLGSQAKWNELLGAVVLLMVGFVVKMVLELWGKEKVMNDE